MDIRDIIKKIERFKQNYQSSSFDIIVKEVKDAEDLYGDLYIVAENNDGESSAELQADDLLLSIENPSKSDLTELRSIAAALKELI